VLGELTCRDSMLNADVVRLAGVVAASRRSPRPPSDFWLALADMSSDDGAWSTSEGQRAAKQADSLLSCVEVKSLGGRV
jgi:hypothetical protein